MEALKVTFSPRTVSRLRCDIGRRTEKIEIGDRVEAGGPSRWSNRVEAGGSLRWNNRVKAGDSSRWRQPYSISDFFRRSSRRGVSHHKPLTIRCSLRRVKESVRRGEVACEGPYRKRLTM